MICFCSVFTFSACKKKEDNLSELSKNLTTYEINLNIDCSTKNVTATQTVNYINKSNNILKNIKFHLYPQFFKEGATNYIVSSTKLNQAYPNGMSYSNFEINRIVVNNLDTSIVYEYELNSILSVELSNSLPPNENVKIYFEYSFTLPNCQHRFGYGENTINLANFYPIACVFENGEFNTSPYNSNGDPFFSDMSNYCVNITADNHYIAAGTGEKSINSSNEKTTTTQFNAKLVRDFALVLSNRFETISTQYENTKIEYYFFDDKYADKSLQAGYDAIKTFSHLFGKYPYSTFSIVKTDFVYGGMEYPNLIMISSDIDNLDDYLNVIIHETAHQWWYGMVGNNEYEYPWLDEALTEYSTILFYDNNTGYNLNHTNMVKNCRDNYSLFISVYEEVLGKIDTSMRSVNEYKTEPEYTYCTYIKGVLMYDSLYQLVGKDKFYKSLKQYFLDNKYTNTTPEKLINTFETVCKQDLTNFFNSWLLGKVVIR